MTRVYDLKIYFADSPNPLYIENVRHMTTEGGLLRLIQWNYQSIWFPLSQIHQINETDRRTIADVDSDLE